MTLGTSALLLLTAVVLTDLVGGLALLCGAFGMAMLSLSDLLCEDRMAAARRLRLAGIVAIGACVLAGSFAVWQML